MRGVCVGCGCIGCGCIECGATVCAPKRCGRACPAFSYSTEVLATPRVVPHRNSILCVGGKALPSKPEVYAWALLVLLWGHCQARASWATVSRLVVEWVDAVLLQKERYTQVLTPQSRRRPTATPLLLAAMPA